MRPPIFTCSLVFILLLVFCSGKPVLAQREADNWYYGWNTGVNFATGSPVLVPHYVPLWASYGSTSLSDSLGNLLFYSDGVELYNRFDQLMPNGTGLIAGQYAPNPCIAFPKPGDAGKYYLFTVGGGTGANKRAGAEYSVIDLSLDNGRGDIISGQKNIPLLAADSTYQTISALAHGSRDAYWVIVRNHRTPNKLLTFLVDKSGVSQTPVVSPCLLYFKSNNNQSEIIKASADGKYLLYADRIGTTGNYGKVELYNFDNITGQLSPALVFNTGGQNLGAEFTSNSDLLYLSNSIYINALYKSKVWVSQYDMSKIGDLAQFENSVVKLAVDTVESSAYGFQLLANNAKIYFNYTEVIGSSVYGYLAAINNPNVIGDGCDIQLKALYDHNAWSGLPTFVSSFMADFDWQGSCAGDTVKFRSRFYPQPVSFSWNFDDLASGTSDTSSAVNPGHVFQTPGTYNVSVSVTFADGIQRTSERLVHILATPYFDLGDTLWVCKGSGTKLSPGSGYASYTWNTGSISDSITIISPGMYSVRVTNDGDCEYADSVWVAEYPETTINSALLTISPTTCSKQTGAITGVNFTGIPPYFVTWKEMVSGSIIGHSPDIYKLGVGIYQLSLTDGNGCAMPAVSYEIKDVGDMLIDTVTFTNALCGQNNGEINIEAVSGLGLRIQYFVIKGNDTVSQWHNGVFGGLTPGVYYAKASDSIGCTSLYLHPITISSPGGPVITGSIVLPATPGLADGSIILSASASTGDTIYYLVNGITQINNGNFDNLAAGDYTCTITDELGCSTITLLTVTELNVQYLSAIAGKGSACLGNTAKAPLYVSNFQNVKSFETSLNYDPAILECLGYIPSAIDTVSLTANTATGKISIKWDGKTPLSLADSSVLIELVFGSKAFGTSSLAWDAALGANHFYDNNGLEILVVYKIGNVVVNNPPVAASSNQNVCEGTTLNIPLTVTGGTGTLMYNWHLPDGSISALAGLLFPQATAANNGNYWVKVADSLNCSDSLGITVRVTPTPVSGFTNDTLLFDQTYTLEANPGYYRYTWSTTDSTYSITVTAEGWYKVTLTTIGGCTATDSVLMLNAFAPLTMPNAFTPNGDILNDVFKAVTTPEKIRSYTLYIYDRWGKQVYFTNDVTQGWDGTIDGATAPVGTYVYYVKYSNTSDVVREKRGMVVLVR